MKFYKNIFLLSFCLIVFSGMNNAFSADLFEDSNNESSYKRSAEAGFAEEEDGYYFYISFVYKFLRQVSLLNFSLR